MSDSDINEEERGWIKSYAAEVTAAFREEFATDIGRFPDLGKLLQRFDNAVTSMLANGRSVMAGVDEAHNELCIASRLLANTNPWFVRLDYEPILPGCARSIDFRAWADDGHTLYVDVKTIKPKPNDRWDQLEKAIKEGWFPENLRVVLSKGFLGGELWHNMFAARARMLEYALELEGKIRDGGLVNDKTAAFNLAFCGDGFHWRQDGLEDFVAFYRAGRHRPDDPFSKAEGKFIGDENITLDRTISRFACLVRSQFEIRPRRVNWNVQPPDTSPL